MKKKVRIYKSPTGKGEFINKTAKFLQKAQMGGIPDPNTIGYPGAEQQVSLEEQISQSIISDIQNERPKEETIAKIVNSFNQDPMTADQFYDQIFNILKAQQQELEDKEVAGIEDEDTDQTSEVQDKVVTQEMENQPDVIIDSWEENNGTKLVNQILSEDDDSIATEDLGEAESQLIMQLGGVMPGEIDMSMYEDKYPIQFSSLSAYLPETMVGDNSEIIEPTTGELSEGFKKGGAYKKAKSKYIKTVLNLKKKVDGGPQAVEESADPIGSNIRNSKLKQFISTIKTNSDYAQAKEQAEQEFENLAKQQMQILSNPYMQNGGEQDIYNGQDYENPMHHLQLYSHATQDIFGDPMNENIKAQYGVQVGNKFRNIRMPKGIIGMPPITKMDVRKSGLFGTPKEYSVEFGQFSPMPGMPTANAGVGFYGYGTTTTPPKKKSPGRIIIEEVSNKVNKKTTEEIASNTPDSTATNKSAEDTKQTIASTPSTVVNSGNKNVNNSSVITNIPEETEYPEIVTETLPTNTIATNKLFVLPSKPGFYYRQKSDGSYLKYKGDPKKHTSSTRPFVSNGNYVYINPEDTSYKYLEKNLKFSNDFNPNKVITSVTPTKSKISNKQNQINAILKKPMNKRTLEEKELLRIYNIHKMNNSLNNISNMFSNAYEALPDVPSSINPHNLGSIWYTDSGYEDGGAIINPQVDMYGNLQRFVYGGDDISIPSISQQDIDDVYSKDTTDGYFQFGGLTRYDDKGEVKSDPYEDYKKQVGDKLNMSLRDDLSAKELFEMGNKAGISFGQKPLVTTNQQQMQYPSYDPFSVMNMMANAGRGRRSAGLFPANLAGSPHYYGKVQKGPYNPLTGQAVTSGFGPNTTLKSIDVTKTGMFGRPKKYTLTYGNPEMDPRKQNLITLPSEGVEGYTGQASSTENQNRFSNTKGLKLGTRAKIAAKELFAPRGKDEVYSPNDNYMKQEPSDNTGGADVDEVKKFQAQQEAKGLVYDDIENKWVPKVTGESAKDAAKDLMAQSKADMEIATSDKLPISSGQGELDKLKAQRQSELENEIVQNNIDRERATMGPVAFEQNNNVSSGQMEIDQDIQDRQKELDQETAYQKEQQAIQDADALDREMGIGTYDPEYNPYQFGDAGLSALKDEQKRMEDLMNEGDLEDQQLYDPTFGQNFGQAGMEALIKDRKEKNSSIARTAAKRNVITPKGNGSMVQPSTNQAASIPARNINNKNTDIDKVQYMSSQEKEELKRAQQRRNSSAEQKRIDKQKKEEQKQKFVNATSEEKAAYNTENKIKNQMNIDYNNQYDKPMQVLNNRRETTFKLIDQRKDLTPAQKQQKKQNVWNQYYDEVDKLDKKWSNLSNQYNTQLSYEPHRTRGSGTSKPTDWKRRYGGLLPEAKYGDNPVTYTDNPALAGMTDVQMITLNPGIQNLSGGINWGQLSATNTVTQGNGDGKNPSYGFTSPTAPTQPEEIIGEKESHQLEKEYAPSAGDVSIDVKNKKMGAFDPEAWLNTGNAAIRGLTKFIGNNESNDFYDNYNSDNMYGASNIKDRGDYVQYGQRLGMFRDPEEGQKRTGRTKQYGGAMNVDDEVYMTDEEIADFLANGGSLEYL